jgi:hypothetical protein
LTGSAYFFVEHNEVQNGESSNTVNDQQELLSMDKPKMPNRRPLVRSYTQLGLENLHNDSKFTQKEVNELYREFKLECPAGYITKDNFQFLFQKFFPMGGEWSCRVVMASGHGEWFWQNTDLNKFPNFIFEVSIWLERDPSLP